MFNPITGTKMLKTWLADELFPSLHTYYREVEALTRRRFFFPMPVYRAFPGIAEQNEWMARSSDPVYDHYVSSVSTGPAFGEKVNDVYGGVTLKQSGYLDTRTYLDAVRDYLVVRDSYLAEDFDAPRLQIESEAIRYGDIRAGKIVFCQGIANQYNPWFGALPIRALKGESLTIQCWWEKDVILNRGVYMVPGTGPGEWRVGATFDRNDGERNVTLRARQELCRKLEDLLRIPYTVTGQQWGFRPTTPDRRPILGAHPEHRSLIVFNGLGTKGVSLAPYFSDVLVRWMEREGTIHKEADVSRFY